MKKPEFPMRINKYLAMKKQSTRKGADALIEAGWVLLNGKKAVLGDKVNENDNVEIVSKAPRKTYKYFAYHKPLGIVTHSPQQEGEQDIQQAIQRKDIFPIGRLDKSSHGLIILTNDGRITENLLSPTFSHEKEYVVRVAEKLQSNFKNRMESGVNIEGYITKKCEVKILNDHVFKIILTEGKKHQIRRMCSALGYVTNDLKRIRIMNIRLGTLPSGKYREIVGNELKLFLKKLGIH